MKTRTKTRIIVAVGIYLVIASLGALMTEYWWAGLIWLLVGCAFLRWSGHRSSDTS